MTESIINDDKSIAALTREAGNAALALWSDEKKKEFVTTFQTRARCTRYLLVSTARQLLDLAKTRRYISDKHTNRIDWAPDYHTLQAHLDDRYHHGSPTIGGRTQKELDGLASQRADVILKELPPIRTATQVIMPDIAKKMERRDDLLEKGKALLEKLQDLSEPISMAAMSQTMTIGAFRKYVQKKADEREALVKELDRIGKEGIALDDAVNKALYAGLPGLSSAVLDVAKQHVERATMLDQLTRRVEERVLFGDSNEAMELLARFEKDEIEVSESIRAEFSKAVEALKLAGLRRKKAK